MPIEKREKGENLQEHGLPSSGLREESPQMSQTNLPWISPVLTLTSEANNNNNRIKPISVFCFSMVEIEKKKQKNWYLS